MDGVALPVRTTRSASVQPGMRVLVFGTYHGDYSTELATALAEKATVSLLIDSDQAATDCGPSQIERFRQKGQFAVVSRRGFGKVLSLVRVGWTLLRFRPDICITHAHYNAYLVFVHRLIALFCPLYLIVHDPVLHTGRDAVLSKTAHRLDVVGRSLASVLLIHGDFCLHQLEGTNDIRGRPVLNVPHGPILRPDRALEPLEPPSALMFGRMEAYKGLDVLLAACRILAGRGRPARCRLMGRGPELERLKADFEAVGADVSCAFVPRETIITSLQQAAFVLAPYTEATQSGVVASAFASGRPVLASAAGGLVDCIQHERNGLLVPTGDPEALADAMDRLFSDPALRRHLSDGATRAVATTLSWHRYADLIIAFWSSQNRQGSA